MENKIAILLLLFTVNLFAVSAEKDLAVLVGDTALLKCDFQKNCGALHSIRWYRGQDRIALLAEEAGIARPEGDMANRIVVSVSAVGEMRINPVKVDDEDDYRCEVTFIQPDDSCETVYVTKLRTLMKPKSLILKDQVGNEIKEDSALGGLLEESQTVVECSAIGGRPAPDISWFVGDIEIKGAVSTSGEGEDAVTTNRLSLEVERKYQGRKLKCSAVSEALKEPMTAETELDLILRPTDLNISGVEHHVVQGTKVTLECISRGARPPAVITWANDSTPLPAEQTLSSSELQSDGTFTTLSRLSFWATRWEHAKSFSCETKQLAAPEDNGNTALKMAHILDVHFPPVVRVSPDIITVNETTDVLLYCEYEANPTKLLSVKWIQNTMELDTESNPDHYEGGNIQQQDLLIKNSSADDIGHYFCQLENPVGIGRSLNDIFVDVHFKPEVELTMEPENYVIESLKQNVTLDCSVVWGNPSTLLTVKWYLDGEVLKQLPDCNATENDGDMCNDVEPTKLFLHEITRPFHGNYSCQGRTLAGWGEKSNDTELIVYYEPGPAVLSYSPEQVVKGQSVVLTCSVQDLGRPTSTRYRWYRGGQLMTEIESPVWVIDPVTIDVENNFTCQAINEAGMGGSDEVFIEVVTPPAMISGMKPYTGFVFNESEVMLTCRVECFPSCGVSWMKNGQPIIPEGTDMDLYTINNIQMDSDTENNYFESTYSQLIFNMSNWPNEVLDRLNDNSNYTCFSDENGIGPGVLSSTVFSVEYPPENMTVSNKVVSVVEGQVPEKVLCSAKAKPEPTFLWIKHDLMGSNNGKESDDDGKSIEVLSKGYALVLKRGVERGDSGDLICEASNKHGKVQINTYLNVMYQPSCSINENELHGEKVIVCTAYANPTEVTFEWELKDENDTIDDEAIMQKGVQSILKLDLVPMPTVEGSRTFVCVANNSVGASEPCYLTIQATLPWYSWWSRTALLVAAGIGILLILVILLCLIILCICRKRRAASKYNSSIPMDDGESACVSPQNELSIVHAIVSESLNGMCQKITSSISPQCSEKSRLVQSQDVLVSTTNKQNTSGDSGRLQADLSQLEASYQAVLLAKQKDLLNKKDDHQAAEKSIINNNNEDDKLNKNDISKTVTSPPITNKWPLKPGVLVHVNSNHSLSPKKFGRNYMANSDPNTSEQKKDESSSLGILERTSTSQATETVDSNKTERIDPEKCKNIMKSNKKKLGISKMINKIDILRSNKAVKSDEDQCISDDQGTLKKVKRTKSNKRALSLVGFTLKDETEDKKSSKNGMLKSIFQSSSPVLLSSEGVVTFRRPPKDLPANVVVPEGDEVISKETNSNNNISSHDTSNSSHSSSGSRKRKKPGEPPGNGVGDKNGNQGIENPGTYENLPFHGLQQAPNKPVQIIQPRIVRTVAATQRIPKTSQEVLQKQLECNPSFTPRVLTCPPYSHNPPHLTISNVVLPNTSALNSYQIVNLPDSTAWEKSQRETEKNYFQDLSKIEGNQNSDDEEQKFHSLNVKKDSNRNEPLFNSMRMEKKRKFEKCYPETKQTIEYVLVKKNDNSEGRRFKNVDDVIYANYPNLLSAGNSSFALDCAEASFQNLTDSIQIYENSPKNNSSDSKTPTPAPRGTISPMENVKKSLREHVYANYMQQIQDSIKRRENEKSFTPKADTPKTLPRKLFSNQDQDSDLAVQNASTLPKRTTKSGKLCDEITDEAKKSDTKVELTKGKVKSSRTPSRNHSFTDQKNEDLEGMEQFVPETLSKVSERLLIHKNDIKNQSPSVVDATPKVKPFLTKSNEQIPKVHDVICKIKNNNPESDLLKNISKSDLPIKKVPLQIPNLTSKPIPKVHPVQKVRRTQSSISTTYYTEYKKQSNNSIESENGSLVRAKIRELNMKQNVQLKQIKNDTNKSLNKTHPSADQKPARLPLKKHHSFCYFQPIHLVKEHIEEDDSFDENLEISGPLIYKPKTINYDQFRTNKIEKNNCETETLNKLHELLKKEPSANRKGPAVKIDNDTYTLGSLDRHKYVPDSARKKLDYADLDLDDSNKSYNDKVNKNNKLFSKESNDEHKKKDLKRKKTEYATLKFEEVKI